jgi:hypothetical protein
MAKKPKFADVVQAACGASFMALGLTRRVVCDLEAGHRGAHSGHDLATTGNVLVSRWYSSEAARDHAPEPTTPEP